MPEADALATAIWVNEIDPDCLKRSAHYVECCTPRLACPGLELVNSHRTNACLFRKLLLGPSDKSPCGSTLCWTDAHARMIAAHKKIFN